ncbi:hypothetical protein Dda_7674 [Drechslerella dactyloides]|uniref:Distal membrane-arm assembly complex protein 1-like domain-containing protein n=1 Tax=Drechslerella dactyloides TaxID=74499 RepID=A0AAD6ISL4_DREDA|nr:hypothetical protein Dda_7674 [Drechslerella dactyloides]
MSSTHPAATDPDSRPLSEEERQRLAKYDCWPCRITGAAAFTGLGGYMLVAGRRQLAADLHNLTRRQLLARKASIHGIGIGLIAAGLYRLIN